MCIYLKESLYGLVGGPLVILAAVAGTYYNEKGYLENDAAAAEVHNAAQVQGCRPDASLNDKLIFAACPHVKAPELSGSIPAPLLPFLAEGGFRGASLKWDVEIYQWVQYLENKTCRNARRLRSTRRGARGTAKTRSTRRGAQDEGSAECNYTYSYELEWTGSALDSYFLEYEKGHDNVGNMPSNMKSGEAHAADFDVVLTATRGDSAGFALDSTLTGQMPSVAVALTTNRSRSDTWDPHCSPWQIFGKDIDANMLSVSSDGYITTCGDCDEPSVGDLRVLISATGASSATISGVQKDHGGNGVFKIVPYPPQKIAVWSVASFLGDFYSKEVNKLEPGVISVPEFVFEWRYENWKFVQGVRAGCFAGFVGGFYLLFRFCQYGEEESNMRMSCAGYCGCFWWSLFLVISWSVVNLNAAIVVAVMFALTSIAYGTYLVIVRVKSSSDLEEEFTKDLDDLEEDTTSE